MTSSSEFQAGPPSHTPSAAPPQPLTGTVWLILIIASIGFAFDIYELLMLPLVLPPALQELLPAGSPDIPFWRGMMFWIPALAGGAFGLYGGYLTDVLGRRRVLTWSILIYAVSAFLAGFSTSMPMLLILRSTTFIGVCVEFVAAVAWLAELFPNHEQRERVLGYTQAFSSIGGLLVAGAFYLANIYGGQLPAIGIPEFLQGWLGNIDPAGQKAAWRYTLMSGVIPAIPLILIRPFLPESPVWQNKKEAGTLRRPSFTELFGPAFRKNTILTTALVACSYGAAFGAIQQMPQIVPAMDEFKVALPKALEAKKGGVEDVAAKLKARNSELTEERATEAATMLVTGRANGLIASKYTFAQEIGGLVGRFILALLILRIASRANLLRLFLIPGIIVMPLVFGYATLNNQPLFAVGGYQVTLLHVGMFMAGVLTVAQFSFWGNYLPTIYPTHLRGTGESVAHNIGGRMIGTTFAYLTSTISAFVPGETDAIRMAYTAAGMGLFVFVVGFFLSFFLPQPKGEMMTE
ncbi:MAG: MFS transporter [Gemmataceae bacterium]|nr:MFS transporter [Gemmataceae bacterium]